jgi:hypothetical protein
MNHNRESAEATANNDRAVSTINGYNLNIKRMRHYAGENKQWGDAIFDTLPLPYDFVIEYLGNISAAKETGKVITASTVGKCVSSLKWLYSMQQPVVKVSDDLECFLKRFKKGHKRTVADLKQEGVMDQHEGKVGFSFTIYTYLAMLFLVEYATDTHYAHLFFVLMWNLIARLGLGLGLPNRNLT